MAHFLKILTLTLNSDSTFLKSVSRPTIWVWSFVLTSPLSLFSVKNNLFVQHLDDNKKYWNDTKSVTSRFYCKICKKSFSKKIKLFLVGKSGQSTSCIPKLKYFLISSRESEFDWNLIVLLYHNWDYYSIQKFPYVLKAHYLKIKH